MEQENSLPFWRSKIDDINNELVRLLNKRAYYAQKIGNIKKEQNLPISDKKRENLIIKTITSLNKGPLPNESIINIFNAIIKETKKLEKRIEIGKKDKQS